jgi:hypothetical protein
MSARSGGAERWRSERLGGRLATKTSNGLPAFLEMLVR